MVFDTEKQKAFLEKLVLQTPAQVTLGQILSGPSDDLVALVQAIRNGKVYSPEDVEAAMTHDAKT